MAYQNRFFLTFLLTDHGLQFYSVRHGESLFDKKLKEMGIEHIMPGIGKPTTTGKIDRAVLRYVFIGSR